MIARTLKAPAGGRFPPPSFPPKGGDGTSRAWAAGGGAAQAAFTLIELVLVMTLLVAVLTVSYRVIVDCLETDARIDKVAQPEKIGEGLMSLVRKDLSGTYFRQFGRRVFTVTDGGTVPDAADQLLFLTTVRPSPTEIGDDESATEVYERDVIMGVHYFLQENSDIESVRAYILYRKEMLDMDPNYPLESSGIAYEIYDKIAFFSVECFDGLTWSIDWDSESRIEYEEEELALLAEEGEGRIARVSDTQGSATTINQAPGVAPEVDPTSLPPAAVPAAVRVEFAFYSGRGHKIDVNEEGQPVLKIFSTTVPLISARRLRIEFDDNELLDEDMEASAREGTAGSVSGGTGGAQTPIGGSGRGRG